MKLAFNPLYKSCRLNKLCFILIKPCSRQCSGKNVAEDGKDDEVTLDFESSSANFTIYQGSYNGGGLPHGKNGYMEWATGDTYKGDFWNGMRDGHGVMIFSDDTEYDGNWECDKMHGHGRRIYSNGNIYIGPYCQGERQGSQGQLQYTNGDTYIGEWSDDEINGKGTIYYKAGVTYHGFFVNGARHGKGMSIKKNGDVAISWFDQGAPKGEGVYWDRSQNDSWMLIDGRKKSKLSAEDAQATLRRIMFHDKGVIPMIFVPEIFQL